MEMSLNIIYSLNVLILSTNAVDTHDALITTWIPHQERLFLPLVLGVLST